MDGSASSLQAVLPHEGRREVTDSHHAAVTAEAEEEWGEGSTASSFA